MHNSPLAWAGSKLAGVVVTFATSAAYTYLFSLIEPVGNDALLNATSAAFSSGPSLLEEIEPEVEAAIQPLSFAGVIPVVFLMTTVCLSWYLSVQEPLNANDEVQPLTAQAARPWLWQAETFTVIRPHLALSCVDFADVEDDAGEAASPTEILPTLNHSPERKISMRRVCDEFFAHAAETVEIVDLSDSDEFDE